MGPDPSKHTGSFRLAQTWTLVAFLSAVLFTIAPQIDLAVSGVFYSQGVFPASNSPALGVLRQVIWNTSAALGVFSIGAAIIAFMRGHFLGVLCRCWSVVVAIYLLGPGLIVNVLLKNLWGRARPNNIVEFGGNAEFTAALWPADQCSRNCSFVSGEASDAVALAVGVWLLTEQVSVVWLRRTLRIVAIALAICGSFMRIAFGRHFLSDVVFAALIVTGLAIILARYSRASNQL